MINLLPDQRKDDIRAARANVILLRYIAIIALALVFIVAIFYVSYSLLQATKASNEATISANDVKADVYKDTKEQVDALSAKLSEANSALDQEVRYSKVLIKLGQLMPAGTVLDDLTLTTATFSGAASQITAYAKSTSEASILQSQFQSSPLFSQVNLQGTSSEGGLTGYPVTITMSVVFNKAGIE